MHPFSILRFVVVAPTSSKQIKVKNRSFFYLSELYPQHYFVIVNVLVFYCLFVLMWFVDHSSSSVVYRRVGDSIYSHSLLIIAVVVVVVIIIRLSTY